MVDKRPFIRQLIRLREEKGDRPRYFQINYIDGSSTNKNKWNEDSLEEVLGVGILSVLFWFNNFELKIDVI